MEHYLDNSATTVTSRAAAEKAVEVMTLVYGNPSSLHEMGRQAEHELRFARASVASRLGASEEEITFVSGGTEANNLALFGAAYARVRSGKNIVISALEHSSVLEAAERLKNEGFSVTSVAPRSDGIIHPDDVAQAVNAQTTLVSVMTVNNESGAIMPVAEIFDRVKLPLRVRALNADCVSVSAHKVHAPKGCGAVFVRKGVRLIPRQYGGEQEKKLRPGTEALPLIAAFGAACEEFDTENNYQTVKALNDHAKERLSQIEGIAFNSPADALPYVLNFSAGRVRSETMLHFLEERGVYVSSGSACAKGKPSHVLSAMGLSRERADSALRVSFSKFNTKEDIDALCDGIELGLKVLRHR